MRKKTPDPFFIVVLLLGGALAQAQSWSELQSGFADPPRVARPNTFYYWLNGNVTLDGVTRDLEAMERVGLGGVLIFDGGVFIPKGPVDYLSEAWLERVQHTVREAERLGLEVALHNGPGWSSSGGPWVTPERSMQQLVWTETVVQGPQQLETTLPQPYAKHNFYRDAAVIAFPSPPSEAEPYQARLTKFGRGDGAEVDIDNLVDGDLRTGIPLQDGATLELQFAEPQEVRSVTAFGAAEGPSPRLALEASDDGETYRPVVNIAFQGPRGIEFPFTENVEPVSARHYRLVAQRGGGLAELRLNGAPRVKDWNFKSHQAFRLPVPTTKATEVDPQFAIDPNKVEIITAKMNDEGELTWDVPPGSWTIMRFGHTSTGQENIAAPDAGQGLECDKFSREAVRYYFDHVVGQVLKRLGPEVGETFVAATIDSYEANLQNWTERFPQDFQAQNGYDLLPYLPAMTGRIVGSADQSDRFLFDVRRTQANLMANNYYGEMADLCHQRGLKFYAEPYGTGPFDELQVGGRADVPMTEFWARFPWGDNRVVKAVASSAHIYGKPIVAAEAFTSEQETGRWLEHPYALKPLGDLMFSQGFNKSYFHRYAHQPHPDARPGMTMGPWGIHYDRTNTWFEVSRPWIDYLARCQYLLQQGTPVADVLYFVGERTPEAAQYTIPTMPPGVTYDLVNAEVLLERVTIVDGRIVLPEGTSYRLLVIPDDVRGMTPELLQKLSELVDDGMTLLGPRTEFPLSLRGYPAADAQFHALAAKLWSSDTGRVLSDLTIGQALDRVQAKPDVEYTSRRPDASLVWAHRRVGESDFYFVANRQRRPDDFVCSFRVDGRRPELWDPATGQIAPAPLYQIRDGRTFVPLQLDPAGSVFVVFREPAAASPPRTLTRNGQTLITADPLLLPPAPSPLPHDTFTVALWVKPDSDLRELPRESARGSVVERGKHYAIVAPDGADLFGEGHAAMGLAVGRNGIYVVERSADAAPAVLVERAPVAGWTHVAVVYQNGRPSLYVNGQFVREGLFTGSVVHPGVAALPQPGVVYYFEGDRTEPEVFAEALSPERIAALHAQGLPAPADPPAAELTSHDDGAIDGAIDATLWQSGAYALDGNDAVDVTVPAPRALTQPWQLTFPAGSGAPDTIRLERLIPLNEHEDPGVRHFSGTATYTSTINLSEAELAQDQRVVLDLGRVEVNAEVDVNGQPVATLWKPPFRADITAALQPGHNTIEVSVTNLWPNRLIGDEQLPAENEYARSGEMQELPAWYVQGAPKPPGGRTTFATWQFFDADEPLLASGLLGPVRLLYPQTQRLKPQP